MTILFLGGQIPGFKFSIPGPDSHARWMGKCIGALKIALLGRQWQRLGEEEERQIRQFATFVAVIYVKYWLQSPLPTAAPRLDLTLYDNILQYRKVNATIALKVRK